MIHVPSRRWRWLLRWWHKDTIVKRQNARLRARQFKRLYYTFKSLVIAQAKKLAQEQA